MSRWLVIGSSPSVVDWVGSSNFGGMTTITCNSGICLLPNPTYYLCVDMVASHVFYERGIDAQKRGTRLLTLRRTERALKERKLTHYDEYLRLPDHADVEYRTYGRFQYSGPLCVQYALVHGATEVHMIGMDGYRRENDYFDRDSDHRKKQCKKNAENVTHNCLAPVLRRCAEIHQDVSFVQYGKPNFVVGEPNWKVITDKSQLLSRPEAVA